MSETHEIHSDQDFAPKETESMIQKQIESVLENFRVKAESAGLEIVPETSYDEKNLTVHVKISVRPISLGIVDAEPVVMEKSLRWDEFISASSGKLESITQEIKENYDKATQAIFVAAGRKALFDAAQKNGKESKPSEMPISKEAHHEESEGSHAAAA